MKQEDYVKARADERKAEKQPSKRHEQPVVAQVPGSKKPIYREQL